MDIVTNKKARFNYEIQDDLEAGIALVGTEVKALRAKRVNLTDSYATFKRDELFLINARIEPYEHGNIHNHDPVRARKLLLHRKELDKLKGKLQQKGWVLVPMKLYFTRGKVKVKLGLGKSKKNFDKRQTIKDRDIKRDMEREMKNYR